jgi:hypothetical protein
MHTCWLVETDEVWSVVVGVVLWCFGSWQLMLAVRAFEFCFCKVRAPKIDPLL